jgi:hypothetical protein
MQPCRGKDFEADISKLKLLCVNLAELESESQRKVTGRMPHLIFPLIRFIGPGGFPY